jgi:hypothetical protein
MTKQEFVDKWKHVLGGMVADAATRPSKGGELSMLLQGNFKKIEAYLSSMYDSLTRPAPTVNGQKPQEVQRAKA